MFISNGVVIYKTYLYNILSVLCRILENGAAVLQILFIKAERPVVHLLETLIPELRFLQVDQEVSVDGATLNQTHAAEWSIGRVCFNHSLIMTFLFLESCGELFDSLDVEVPQEDGQTLTCSLDCKFTGAVHLIKRETCERTWSNKMGCFGNFKHGALKHKQDLFRGC